MTKPSSAGPSPPPESPPTPTKLAKDLKLEMFVFFCLGVLMPFVSAVYMFAFPEGHMPSINASMAMLFFQSVACTVPALYMLHRTQEGWGHFAIVRPVARTDITGGVALGLLLFGTSVAFWTAAVRFLPTYMLAELHQQPNVPRPPEDFPGMMLFFSANAANGIREELFMRCYFVTRIRDQTGSWLKALMYSAALFASYHIYYGVLPMVSIFALGLVLGLAFVIVRRLWTLAIAHMVLNILVFYLPLGQTLSG
ncbi:MAG: CPBP family intramembrane metalloprotease [Planctomycetes bacterium]|nr:CPBP family intramembrane metalloprotease [Planctomycetota bacterium]